ncbi:MAG: putative DNA-binding domain-containing protein [Pseudomonadales bacterium]|nr:putative DNA-binding domain-containing protein [Pseudomonadales bacterium]
MVSQTVLPPDSELLKIQTAFTQHLRNPDSIPVPQGLDARRMGIYSDLIFNNISSLISEFFPVIFSLTDSEDWRSLIREFFINYQCETPYFPKLADEFLQFLMGREGTNHEPDYLVSLAHYEWLELCLFTSESELPVNPLDKAELKHQRLHLSDLAIPITYEYPVQQISNSWQYEAKQASLLLFRDQHDSVRFFELQPLAFELLTTMQQESGILLPDWLHQKARASGPGTNIDNFIKAGIDLVEQFNREKLIYTSDTSN